MDRYKEEPKKSRKPKVILILFLLILLLAVLIAGLVFYIYKSTEESLSVSFTEESPEVEFGGKYAAMDYVKESIGEVQPSAEYLDASSTGSKELTYTVSRPVIGGLLTPSKAFTFSYTVIDTVDPIILWNGSGSTIVTGSDFDIHEYISYGDNADPAPEFKVKGKVKTKEAGSYTLHVTVTDASGNSTKDDMTINVVDELPEYTSSSESTKFADFVSKYKGDGKAFGIDVSTWQGGINFKKVKKAGCEFVMIRIGWSEEGTLTQDTRFAQNIKRAKAAGLKVGIYLYSYDNTEEYVRSSAKQLTEILGDIDLELPVVFDWEDFGHFEKYNMSFTDLNHLYDVFAEELANDGRDCMLYGSLNYLEKVWTDTDSRPVWLAHYADKTTYKGPYRMWQASCTGRISGIDGDVDLDILYE